jgi:nitroreductase/FMN reductase [NAD(P)H]
MSSQTLNELLAQRFGEVGTLDPRAAHSDSLAEMAAHRSHRRYKAEPVAEESLATALACAFTAPAKSDLQQACVVRIEEPGLRERIDALFPGSPWIATAPVFLVWCGDNRRIRRICEMRGKAFANDHLDSFFNASVDAALVMMSFIRAAEALGLGCCPLSELRNSAATVAELLELPPYVFPVAGMVVGWPAQEGWISARLPLAATVHTDRYDDSDLGAQVEAYDARRRAIFAIPDEKQRMTDRYGLVENYGWSEDKARQVSEPARHDFGAFIRHQGFTLE